MSDLPKLSTKEEFINLAKGYHDAILRDIQLDQQPTINDPTKMRRVFVMTFDVFDDDGNAFPRKLWCTASLWNGKGNLQMASKLYKLLLAYGEPVGDKNIEYLFDPNDWLNKPMKVFIDHVTNAEGRTYDRITEWKPARPEFVQAVGQMAPVPVLLDL